MSVQEPTYRDVFKIFLLGSVWSTSFIFMRILTFLKVDPYTVVFFRSLIGLICISFLFLIDKLKFPKKKKDQINIFIVGTVGTAFPFLLLSYASLYIQASTTTIINAFNPLLALVFAYFFRKEEKITFYKIIGVFMGLFGVFLIFGEDTFSDDSKLIYKLAALGATFCYVIGSNFIIKISKEVSIINLVFWSLLVSTLFSFLFFLVFSMNFPPTLNLNIVLSLVYLGIFPTAIGWFARFKMVHKFGYTFVSNVGFVIPVMGVFFGVIILSEKLSFMSIFAFILIMTGMLIGTKRKIK